MKVLKGFSRICMVATLVVSVGRPGFAGQSRTAPGAGGIAERANPAQHHLEIVALTVPPQVELGKRIDVAVTAADKDGVWYVEVRRGEETRRFFAGGERLVSFVATFERASFADLRVQATAFDHDRMAGLTVDAQLIVVGPQKGGSNWETPVAHADPGYALMINGPLPRNQMKPPAGTPWWTWWAANFAKPYPWQSACPGVVGVTINGEVLHCWLNNHPDVRAHIIWEAMSFTGQDDLGTEQAVGVGVPYDQWSWPQQHQLDQAFYYAYQYLSNGATNFGGTPLPDVPNNLIPLADSDGASALFSKDDAWRLYIGTIAHSLALEIGGLVPWSVTSYKPEDLDVLFNQHSMMVVNYLRFHNPERSFTGYGSETIPAPPVVAFQFMLDHDVIRGNHAAVIGQLLEFTRADMVHLGGIPPQLDALNTLMAEVVWGYRGDPPVASMMKKRVMHDPITNTDLFGGTALAISPGCWGAAEFFQAVLRAANIPVTTVPTEPRWGNGLHGTAEFHTANLALPDGDDAYGLRVANSVPMAPAGQILITQQTREAWFDDPSLPMFHNGRHQDTNMALANLANVLVQYYCADKHLNLPHATSSVALFFDPQDGAAPFQTVQDLEAMDLWTKLAAKEAQLKFYCQ